MIGKTISHYKILEKLGEGGMGVVYKALDTKLDRTVALKFLPPHLSINQEEKKRFIHEAKAAATLDHPNICNIFEIDETKDGQMFIAMGYYEGQTLKDKISGVGAKGGSPLPINEAIDVTIQIAEGLHEAHEKKIIHRDIKSANIIITDKGVAKILDFGLAKLKGQTKLTKEGTTLGTVAYMSPEQATGDNVDHRTDIWSLGVVIYEMIIGQLPFKGDYEQAVIYSILNEDPQPIASNRDDIPLELPRILTKALSKDTDNRYQTIGELLSDLKSFASGEYIPRSYKSSKISKKHFQRWQFLALSVLILLIASILYIAQPFRSDSQIIKSIAVLPFDNYTGSEELEYFVAGMHSSLIADISKISALRVISKTTSNAYKDVEKSIKEIASELNVDAVIEASVISLGDSIRIQVKLVRAFPEEQQLWVQDYYEDKSQILNLYNKITKEISKKINVLITPQEENLLAETKSVNPEAYDAYMKGRYYWEQLTPDGLQKALEYFNISLEKDSDFAPAYAGIAEVWQARKQVGFASPSIAIPKIYQNLNKALELDPNSANSHSINARVAFLTEWNWEKSEKEFLKVLEINPNHALSRILYAHLLMCLRRTDEAYEQGKLSLELDPLNPLVQVLFGTVLLDRGDYDEVLSLTKKNPNNPVAISLMETSYYAQGDYQNSFGALMQYLQLYFPDKETIFDIQKTYEKEGYKAALENAVNALEEKAQNSFVLPFDLICLYRSELNKPEKTLELLEKAFETHSPGMPYISSNVYVTINYVKDNPRFIELLKKMNLPLR
jgi:serine/threonine protein kinase